MIISIRRRTFALMLALLPLAACADSNVDVSASGNGESVIVGVTSAYQASVLGSRTRAFVNGLGKAVQRPVYMAAITDANGLERLQRDHKYYLLFAQQSFVERAHSAVMTPLAQTSVTLALYAKPRAAAENFDDIKRVSIRGFENVEEITAELSRVNSAITLIPLESGTDQMGAMIKGSVDGVVMNVSMFANLMPSLRDHYVARYTFKHRQRIYGFVSGVFTAQEIAALRSYLLNMPDDAFSQLHQVFGVSRFEMP